MQCNLMYAGGYGSVAAAWWAHQAVAAGLLLQQPHQPSSFQTSVVQSPPSPALGCSSPTRRCTPEKARYGEYHNPATSQNSKFKTTCD